ncbi:HlyD family type I secretion periplasmic adaptor subunit [Phyllobacterium sp. YR531]|uniref:HlyD family type I secretion periplasmic adaptor subunit n=1 Tax=Phyllobacterium sp. YR531 TaxID=1144343 RepID=UPI00026F9912|nr:HlyD family type I secretion periplasmic adaptor subunit [Phyllobacterium sp. YR531]EJM99238.1 type I secretion membrane fusion protein, HlyD family [Phyllobacterium sp. YR531]
MTARPDHVKTFRLSIRRYLLVGLALCLFLVGVMGTLAATLNISGAVIANGLLVVSSNVKKIQHPTGGVVAEILVENGSKVKAGQLLVRLDATLTKANLAIQTNILNESEARLARLTAELDGSPQIKMPAAFIGRENEPAVKRLMAEETSQFDLRAKARNGQKSQLRERIIQLGQEISGLEQQQSGQKRQMELIKMELSAVSGLWDQKLVSLARLTSLQREAARLDGDYGGRTATIAQTRGRATEMELQILQIDQNMRSEVAAEVGQVQAKISEASERKSAAEDQLNRIDIRSPQDGLVHELAVHTIGGVVSPAEPLMMIVPSSDELTVEVRVLPQDIDQLHLGQPARIRLSAFSQQTTPELTGTLKQVAADLTIDRQSGAGYYSARVTIPPSELAKLRGLTLTAGMPAEAFFITGERTMLSYLVKPLVDQIDRSFRGD